MIVSGGVDAFGSNFNHTPSLTPSTIKVIVCKAPGPVSVLEIQEVPIPVPNDDQVLIKVSAFGINRAGKWPSFAMARHEG